MSDDPVLVPVAVCEVCWLLDHSRWEPHSMDADGKVLMRLLGIDVPEKVNDGSVETCSICGSVTIAGIYEFRDKTAINYLDNDDTINDQAMELGMDDFGDDVD